MEYMTVTQAAEKWGLSSRRVRLLCAQGAIGGVKREGRLYMIPAAAARPVDRRKVKLLPNSKFAELFAEIDAQKAELDGLRPLTPESTAFARGIYGRVYI